MATIFLKLANDHNNEKKYFAIDETKIEELNVSDSYDQYGQRISTSDAGDYLEINETVTIETESDWIDEPNEIETFEAGTNVTAFDQHEAFAALIEKYEDGKEVTLHETKFSGFNYWDGHNWRTVSVSSVDDSHEYEIETDETIVARLNEALENKEEYSTGPGTVTYRYKDIEIVESNWQGHWEEYTITLDNDFEDEQI